MPKAAKSKTITVKVNEQNPEPLDILAKSIIEVAEGFKKINNSRLNRKAVILLLQNAVGGRVTQSGIDDILTYGAELEKLYLKPADKK